MNPLAAEESREAPKMYQMTVSPRFFHTMGIPLLAGRMLTDRDDDKAPRVVVINETAARQYFNPENPIGKRFGNLIENRAQTEIVGVVRDIKYNSLREPAPPTMYLPLAQCKAIIAFPASDLFVKQTCGDRR